MKETQTESLDFQNTFPEIAAQTEKCCLLRDQILKYLEEYPELSEEKKYAITPASTISDHLHYLENSYEFIEKECVIENIDRTASMFGGPFYCSQKYHQVRDENGDPMFPVLQLDLRWINKQCHKSFPNGLLQLWIDKKWNKHVLRVIPWGDVNAEQAVTFDWGELHNVSNKRTKHRSAPWPIDPNPKLLIGVIPMGMSCLDISGYLDHSEHVIPDDLLSTIDELEAIMPALGTHLFGKFYDPQSGPGDFLPYKLFLTLVDWGASGRAHIFYLPQENGDTLFKFTHCGR